MLNNSNVKVGSIKPVKSFCTYITSDTDAKQEVKNEGINGNEIKQQHKPTYSQVCYAPESKCELIKQTNIKPITNQPVETFLLEFPKWGRLTTRIQSLKLYPSCSLLWWIPLPFQLLQKPFFAVLSPFSPAFQVSAWFKRKSISPNKLRSR